MYRIRSRARRSKRRSRVSKRRQKSSKLDRRPRPDGSETPLPFVGDPSDEDNIEEQDLPTSDFDGPENGDQE